MNNLVLSLKYIRRAPFQALAAIMVLSVTFFVSTLILLVIYATNQVLIDFETRPQVIAFIKPDTNDDKITNLKNILLEDQRLKGVTYISKEEALNIYKNSTEDNPLLGELVSPQNFPASLEFSVKDLNEVETVMSEIKENEIIESIGFTAAVGGEKNFNDVITRLKNIAKNVRIVGIIFASILIFTSVLVLMIIISLRLVTRKYEIETLSLMGARSWFIKSPIIYEAIIYSIIGVFIGIFASVVLLLYISPSIYKFFGEIPVIPKKPLDLASLIITFSLIEMAIGVVIAAFAGFISSGRALTEK